MLRVRPGRGGGAPSTRPTRRHSLNRTSRPSILVLLALRHAPQRSVLDRAQQFLDHLIVKPIQRRQREARADVQAGDRAVQAGTAPATGAGYGGPNCRPLDRQRGVPVVGAASAAGWVAPGAVSGAAAVVPLGAPAEPFFSAAKSTISRR